MITFHFPGPANGGSWREGEGASTAPFAAWLTRWPPGQPSQSYACFYLISPGQRRPAMVKGGGIILSSVWRARIFRVHVQELQRPVIDVRASENYTVCECLVETGGITLTYASHDNLVNGTPWRIPEHSANRTETGPALQRTLQVGFQSQELPPYCCVCEHMASQITQKPSGHRLRAKGAAGRAISTLKAVWRKANSRRRRSSNGALRRGRQDHEAEKAEAGFRGRAATAG